ncbi:hypothetical protein AHF37_08514, partial [Paragonimus kellicotti]
MIVPSTFYHHSIWEDVSLEQTEGCVVLGSILVMLAINLLIALITIFTLFTNVQRRYFRRSEPSKRSLTITDSQKDATRAALQESPQSEVGDRRNLNHSQMRVSRTNGLSESKPQPSITTGGL